MTEPNGRDAPAARTFTLYLIRHGEAVHNIMEKLAREQAKKDAEAEGLGPEEVQQRMKEAQEAVLNDDSLFDAPLSEAGNEEAERARRAMQELHSKGFPPPDEVYVSPLQRAMQTAALIFPECTNIHVREDLRERKTGRACDRRQSSGQLAQRGSFSRFSLVNLRATSCTESMLEELKSIQPKDIDENEVVDIGLKSEPVEEKPMLRSRTKKLARFLMDTDKRVIAAVTHKAFLRELERGTFGQEDASEFSNCEVRVYKVNCEHYDLGEIERVA